MAQTNAKSLKQCAFTIDSYVLDIELVQAGDRQSIGRPVLSFCSDSLNGNISFFEIAPKDYINRQLTHPLPSVTGNRGARHELER